MGTGALAIFGTWPDANVIGLFNNGGNATLRVYDSSAASKDWATTGGIDTSSHFVLGSVGGRVFIDGAEKTVTASGAGTGLTSTIASTVLLGAFNSSTQINGTISRFVQCKKAQGCR